MRIKNLRKKLRNNSFIDEIMIDMLDKLKSLHSFYTFECNVFLRGEYLAKENYIKFSKQYNRIIKIIEFLKKQKQKNNNDNTARY